MVGKSNNKSLHVNLWQHAVSKDQTTKIYLSCLVIVVVTFCTAVVKLICENVRKNTTSYNYITVHILDILLVLLSIVTCYGPLAASPVF